MQLLLLLCALSPDDGARLVRPGGPSAGLLVCALTMQLTRLGRPSSSNTSFWAREGHPEKQGVYKRDLIPSAMSAKQALAFWPRTHQKLLASQSAESCRRSVFGNVNPSL